MTLELVGAFSFRFVKKNARINAWFNTSDVGIKVITTWIKNMMALIDMHVYVTKKSPRHEMTEQLIQKNVPNMVLWPSRHKS